MRVLVLIPAYNESLNLPFVVKQLEEIKISNVSLDYLIINDGSTDNTRDVCLKNHFHFLDLPFNLGIGGAVQTGYLYAYFHDYDIAIQFDGDGQHDAHYIACLIDEIVLGNDMVIGSRFTKVLTSFQSTKVRRIGISFLASLIHFCTGVKVSDPTSGFRAVNKKGIELFARYYPSDYPEPDTIVLALRNHFKVKEVPVKMKERQNGKSSIGVISGIYYMIKVSLSIILTSFSHKKE